MLEKLNPKNILSKIISLRDVLILIGFSSLAYGLYLYKPLVCFIICGFLVMVGGLSMKEN